MELFPVERGFYRFPSWPVSNYAPKPAGLLPARRHARALIMRRRAPCVLGLILEPPQRPVNRFNVLRAKPSSPPQGLAEIQPGVRSEERRVGKGWSGAR